VTAEAFRRALENLSRFEWRGVPFSAWLFRIAANAATDHFKQVSRERSFPELTSPADESWETRLIEVETRARLFELVERLPKDQRRVLVMRFGEEKSIKEIGKAMGKSEGAIKALQHRGMESLRARLGDEND
jgi:RNA polymerase sigma-70 factor, ECF subfamily